MPKISRCVFAAISLLLAVSARSYAVEDSCRQMAVSGEPMFEMFVGPSAICRNKDDLALLCGGLVKKIQIESQENSLVRYFMVPNAPCKDKNSVQAFCKIVQSYDGYQIFKNDGTLKADPWDPDYASLKNPYERAAKVCGTTPEAIHSDLCGKSDQPSRWDFAIAECPAQGKEIYKRECGAVKQSACRGEGQTGDDKACRKFEWCNRIKERFGRL